MRPVRMRPARTIRVTYRVNSVRFRWSSVGMLLAHRCEHTRLCWDSNAGQEVTSRTIV